MKNTLLKFRSLFSYVFCLFEVGEPIKEKARALDREAAKILADLRAWEKNCLALKAEVKDLWTAREILDAQGLAQTKEGKTVFIKWN